MSEEDYRRRLSDLIAHEAIRPDLKTFLEGLAASEQPLAEQLASVLDLDESGKLGQGPFVTARLKIHELAPTMIRFYQKITYESFEAIMVQLIGHLDHEDIVPFFVNLLQTKQDSHFHFTVLGALDRYQWQSSMEAPLSRIVRDTTALSYTRQNAIRIIASQPDKTLACSLLLPLLQDSDQEVRSLALIHLKDVGDLSLTSSLAPLLEDKTALGSGTIGEMAQYILDVWTKKTI
jgi:hypothetical protein